MLDGHFEVLIQLMAGRNSAHSNPRINTKGTKNEYIFLHVCGLTGM